MINNEPVSSWGVKTGFLLVLFPLFESFHCKILITFSRSFAGTGTFAVVIAWFILPEVTRRTPAEIDEMYVSLFVALEELLTYYISRFEKKVNLRKFKGYVTEVELRSNEHREDHEMVVTA